MGHPFIFTRKDALDRIGDARKSFEAMRDAANQGDTERALVHLANGELTMLEIIEAKILAGPDGSS